jgi:hypothetical protein
MRGIATLVLLASLATLGCEYLSPRPGAVDQDTPGTRTGLDQTAYHQAKIGILARKGVPMDDAEMVFSVASMAADRKNKELRAGKKGNASDCIIPAVPTAPLYDVRNYCDFELGVWICLDERSGRPRRLLHEGFCKTTYKVDARPGRIVATNLHEVVGACTPGHNLEWDGYGFSCIH